MFKGIFNCKQCQKLIKANDQNNEVIAMLRAELASKELKMHNLKEQLLFEKSLSSELQQTIEELHCRLEYQQEDSKRMTRRIGALERVTKESIDHLAETLKSSKA